MNNTRFLLIKSWGYSLWADVEHVLGQLLVAEITGRTPVVHWGMDSLYSESMLANSFELFFEPISDYTIYDVIHPDYTYYPSVYSFENVMVEDPDKLKWTDRSIDGMIKSQADVVVSDVSYHISTIIPYIRPENDLYGFTPHQVYRYLYDKYLFIKPEIVKEAQKFIYANHNFRDEKPVLGVHMRGNGIVNEIGQIYNVNDFYHPNVWQFLTRFEIRHIFLITDSKKVEREFKKLYGKYDVLISSNSRKIPLRGRIKPCLSNYPNERHKGVELIKDTYEIIKDTYLALQCDFFIGNGYSSLSNAVMRMKDWPETNIRLLY